MSDCWKPKPADTTRSNGPATCPRCGGSGKPVQIITLKSLLAPEAMKRLDAQADHHFCKAAHCSVVYFSSASLFTKDELMVPVHQKDSADSVPACYCFGFTRESIAEEIERTGTSTVVQQVTGYVKGDKCACEMRNPQGSCCLGNLAQTVKQAQGTMRAVTT